MFLRVGVTKYCKLQGNLLAGSVVISRGVLKVGVTKYCKLQGKLLSGKPGAAPATAHAAPATAHRSHREAARNPTAS